MPYIRLGRAFRKLYQKGFPALWERRRLNVDTMYILEMPLRQQDLNSDVEVECIRSIEPLVPIIMAREKEDSNWPSCKYKGEIAARFSRGDWCYAAKENGQIKSFMLPLHHMNIGPGGIAGSGMFYRANQLALPTASTFFIIYE